MVSVDDVTFATLSPMDDLNSFTDSRVVHVRYVLRVTSSLLDSRL